VRLAPYRTATSLAIGLSLVLVTTRAPATAPRSSGRYHWPLAAQSDPSGDPRWPPAVRVQRLQRWCSAGVGRRGATILFGVKRAVDDLVLPTLCRLFVWHAWAFGWRLAAFFRCHYCGHADDGPGIPRLRRLPFASTYQPEQQPDGQSVVLVVTLLGVTALPSPGIERSVLRNSDRVRRPARSTRGVRLCSCDRCCLAAVIFRSISMKGQRGQPNESI
jgi:hypothetical protein